MHGLGEMSCCMLLVGALLAVMMADCVLVCSTSGCGRMHSKQETPVNATLCWSLVATPKSSGTHALLVGALLAVMMAGCVLVCSTSGCGRMHCMDGRALS